VSEFFAASLLCYVHMNTTTILQLGYNSYFGLAVGMSVTALLMMVAPSSGGAINPCFGMMGLVTGGGAGEIFDFWVYWAASLGGAACATMIFRLVNFDEFHLTVDQRKRMVHQARKISITTYMAESTAYTMHTLSATSLDNQVDPENGVKNMQGIRKCRFCVHMRARSTRASARELRPTWCA
jgi:hypothetical protein